VTGALDFALDEDVAIVRDLAKDIFAARADVERVRLIEKEHCGHDTELWATLADSGLLGIALPEEVGGSGLGMLGLVTLAEQQGRRVAPVRLVDVVAGAAFPLAEAGDHEQRAMWLEPLLDGRHIVAGAWQTDGSGEVIRAAADPAADGSWIVSGTYRAVPAAGVASALVAPICAPSGETVVVVVPLSTAGVTVTPESVTDRGNAATVRLSEVRVPGEAALDGAGGPLASRTLERLRVAQAALQVGVCEEALAITAAYTSQRHQFGRPLSTNQGVAIRAADAYLDTEAIRLTTQRAAWLLDGHDDSPASPAVLVAAMWAARAGLRVVHATQHLHGGIGADIDYPIHRYFLWGRHNAFTLGSAASLAAELGGHLPDAPRIGAPA
jgi:alkylation response protein AidB-like acyl-CoA dehydrogenase